MLGNHCLAVFCAQRRKETGAKTIRVRFMLSLKSKVVGYSVLTVFSNVGMQTTSFNTGEHFALERSIRLNSSV